MDPATISIVIGLLVRYGPSAAQMAHDLYENIRNGKPPTAEQVQALISECSRTASVAMGDAISRSGIDPNSQRAKDLAALTA